MRYLVFVEYVMKQVERFVFVVGHALVIGAAWIVLGWIGPALYILGVISACVQLYVLLDRASRKGYQ